MKIKQCPLFSGAWYKYTKDLSNETFELSFRWSDRSQQWVMKIADAEGVVVARSIALVPLFPLTEQLSLEKPVGEFVLVPIEKTSPEIPNPREIYKTHQLYYISD